MICDETPTRSDDAGQGHLGGGSKPGDGLGGWIEARRRRRAEHRMHRRPHRRRWAVSAIASWVRCRGHPPKDDRWYGCDDGPRKKHLHDRACAAECHTLASPHSTAIAGTPSAIRAPWWPCSWPCGCGVAMSLEGRYRRWRIARRSRRSAARWAATVYSRRQTTRVVGWSNDTLSSEHEAADRKRVGGCVVCCVR